MIEYFPWLTVIVLLPLVAALFIPLIPDQSGKTVRWYALGVGTADLVLMSYAFWRHYDASQATFQLAEKVVWLPKLGLSWALSVDGISAPLVLLAGLVTTLSMFAAWQVNRRSRLFYALMLILYAAQLGVFLAQDLVLFFIMWEVELVPVYLLVSIWGGQNRDYAATKFLMYTALSSIFILVAALGMGLYGDTLTFDIAELGRKQFPLGLELFLYAGLLVSFGVKLAIFPFHTWLPDTHGEASSPVSMVLAGVLLKMGGYGLIRLNLELLPHAHAYFAPLLVILGGINIVYGALNSFAQTNMKRRLAYSSVSHMGFVLLGIASYTDLGVSGAMLQMLSHGLIASVLFFLAGVTYDRSRTMMMNQLGGLGEAMPTVFALFTMGTMASLALPGMSGFAGELEVFVGLATTDIYGSAFRSVAVFLAAVGLILTPIYLLSMVRQVFHGASADQMCDLLPACDLDDLDLKAQGNQEANCFGTDCVLPAEAEFRDANAREIFIAACFLGLIIAIGCYPKMATQMYDVKAMAVNDQVLTAYHETHPDALQRLAKERWSSAISATQSADVLGVVK